MASKNDEAWQTLFVQHDILREIDRTGFFEIEAQTIRAVREPRLMSKFDHQANLPQIFQENALAILPISRSRYVIGRFDAYHSLAAGSSLVMPTLMAVPEGLSSIDPSDLYSESAVLHCAYASGMIDAVMGEKSLPTVSGRMSSGDFDFWIRSRHLQEQHLTIARSQVEIDAGYETQSAVMLIEAKNESVRDFLIRQLYYPYRLWIQRVAKPVMPVFLTFSNDVFSFSVFAFEDPQRYNSLRLVQQYHFAAQHEQIILDDILEVLATTKPVSESTIPFPQADVFARVVDLLGILVENDLTKDEVTLNYAFDERQTNYYATAGMYLGLIERYQTHDHVVGFRLSRTGRAIMRLPFRKKYLTLASAILEHEVFRRVLREQLQEGSPLRPERIVYHMRGSGLHGIESASTFSRRAQTIARWVEWIVALAGPRT